jgi:hypothetical protein
MWQRQASALLPIGPGERIDVAIKVVRRNFLTFVKAALPVAIVAAVVSVLIVLTMISSSIHSFSSTVNPTTGQTTVNAAGIGAFAGGFLLLEVFVYVVFAMITAMAIRIVGNAYLGQPAGWRDALSFGFRRFHSVLWIEFLLFLCFLGIEVVYFLIAAVAARVAGSIAFIVVLAEAAGAIWFGVSTILAVPIAMLENVRGSKALARSFRLVRRRWWSTFGTLVLAALISLVTMFFFFLIWVFLSDLLRSGGVLTAIVGGLAAMAMYLLIFTFFSAVEVVIMIDLRVRKEGFDIQLLASQMGTTPTGAALSFMPPAPGGYGGYGSYSGEGGYGGYPPPPGSGGYGGYPPPPGSGGYGGYPPPPGPGGYSGYQQSQGSGGYAPPPGGVGGYGGYPPPGSGAYSGYPPPPPGGGGSAQPPTGGHAPGSYPPPSGPAWQAPQTPPGQPWNPQAPAPGTPPGFPPPAAASSIGESLRPLPPFVPRELRYQPKNPETPPSGSPEPGDEPPIQEQPPDSAAAP